MKIDKSKLEELKGKIETRSFDESLKLIYTWVKTDVIDLKTFKELIEHNRWVADE